jgi:Mg2+ and Co2+ transporter CorA
MPEMGWAAGYPFTLSPMVLTTLVGYRYFEGKDWL